MKKWFLISLFFNLLILLALMYASLTWRGHMQSFMKNFMQVHYEQKATMFEVLPVRDSAIIFLGNSITDGANWAESKIH